jgi:hypothetical protein
VSALDAAREFYSLYVTIPGAASEFVVDKRPELITEQLATALRADEAASAANADEIVGFDADPFLDTQEPCERYEPRAGEDDGKRALLPVFATCLGQKSERPAFLVELVREKDAWRVGNIFFDRRGDLLSELKKLKEERERPR